MMVALRLRLRKLGDEEESRMTWLHGFQGTMEAGFVPVNAELLEVRHDVKRQDYLHGTTVDSPLITILMR